jgi:hypothetical protein
MLLVPYVLVSLAFAEPRPEGSGLLGMAVLVGCGLVFVFRPRVVVGDDTVDVRGLIYERTLPRREVTAVAGERRWTQIVLRPEIGPPDPWHEQRPRYVRLAFVLTPAAVAEAIGVPGPERVDVDAVVEVWRELRPPFKVIAAFFVMFAVALFVGGAFGLLPE